MLPHRAIYTGDNLPILRGMNSESVDLIYLDPPFNTGRGFPLPTGKGQAKKDAERAFNDTWKLSEIHKDEHLLLLREYPAAYSIINSLAAVNGKSWRAYLIYMGARLVEMRRILKSTGSVYFHCDPNMSHGVKVLMDSIFGRINFRNEVAWCYHSGGASKWRLPWKHDIILVYGKDAKHSVHNILRMPYRDFDAYNEKGSKFHLYHPDGKMLHDWWEISLPSSKAKDKPGYPTAKPIPLLERIVKISSNKDDLVLDPFCGCATTCVAAQHLRRRWIGIDISPKATQLLRKRLAILGDAKDTPFLEINIYKSLQNLPQRTDLPARTPAQRLKPFLHKKQEEKCNGCGKKTRIGLMDIDHIISRKRGGLDVDDNLQLLCRQCNVIKGPRSMNYLLSKLMQAVFDERLHRQAIDALGESQEIDSE